MERATFVTPSVYYQLILLNLLMTIHAGRLLP
jgi:hypothetical protein